MPQTRGQEWPIAAFDPKGEDFFAPTNYYTDNLAEYDINYRPKDEYSSVPNAGETVGHPPQLGTLADSEHRTAVAPGTKFAEAPSLWERYSQVFTTGRFYDQDNKEGAGYFNRHYTRSTLWDRLTGPAFPMKPEMYMDPYLKPATCPEEFWWNPWRWPNTKLMNPKIPAPVNGQYQDYYHYLAYKHWLRKEREVYIAQCHLAKMTVERCLLKEGQNNGPKNCRHLFAKFFSMTRQEEFNQTLLYMAITGENAIRETPYPENFVEEKRKVFDDWLFRTRMKKPGDIY